MRLRLVLALWFLAAPGPLFAQRLAPAGVAAARPLPRGASRTTWAAADRRRPRAWPYWAGGAALGALVTAGGLALAVAHSDKEFLGPPFALIPVVVGGAALGAGAGYVVYRIRF